MLRDLYLLQTYFAEPSGVVYEQDLVRRYGRQAVRAAIGAGWLEHRRVPCGKGRRRCVCRLSEKGRSLARAGISAA